MCGPGTKHRGGRAAVQMEPRTSPASQARVTTVLSEPFSLQVSLISPRSGFRRSFAELKFLQWLMSVLVSPSTVSFPQES